MKKHVILGLFWGLFMFIGMEIVFPLLRPREITVATLTAGAFIWVVAGLGFGFLSLRERKKPVDKQ